MHPSISPHLLKTRPPRRRLRAAGGAARMSVLKAWNVSSGRVTAAQLTSTPPLLFARAASARLHQVHQDADAPIVLVKILIFAGMLVGASDWLGGASPSETARAQQLTPPPQQQILKAVRADKKDWVTTSLPSTR